MYEGGEEERDNVMSTSYNKITAKTAHPDGPHDHDHDHHDVEAHTECDDEDGEKGSKASEKPTAATTTAVILLPLLMCCRYWCSASH